MAFSGVDIEEPGFLVTFARPQGLRQETDIAGISGGSWTRFDDRRCTKRLHGRTRLARMIARSQADSGRAGDFHGRLRRSLLLVDRERILGTFRFRANPADRATNTLFVDRVTT